MRVLFIARNYPPDIGGAERLNYELARNLKRFVDLELILNRFGKYSPFFHVYAFFKALLTEVDVVFLSDPYLSPLVPFLKLFKRRPVVMKVHGLEITYANILYQSIIPRLTSMDDKIICISDATKEECIKRGIDAKRCIVIPVGISDEFHVKRNKDELRRIISEKLC